MIVITIDKLISDIYVKHKDIDGILYFKYAEYDSFGSVADGT